MGGKSKTESPGLHLDGLEVAPGVLERIVALAGQDVEGVVCTDASGIAGLMHKAGKPKPIEVGLSADGAFEVTMHLSVEYGRPLRSVAADVQRAVAEALHSQTGRPVGSVDICIDAITFPSE